MFVTSKVKQEVTNARTRLDATLQSLVDKKEDSLDSPSESEDEPEVSLPISVPVVRVSSSPASSPSKRAFQRSKKRKRKHDSLDEADVVANYHSTTYVMKLFDRSVDLAQFNESTPLYVIARAWLNNNQTTTEDSQPEDNVEEEQDTNNVYKLPPPIKWKIEKGTGQTDYRIPIPLACDEDPLDIHKNPDLGPPPEELLLRHMARWKKIRHSWVAAARLHELKYNNSMVVLTDIYEKNMHEQNFE